MKFQFAILLILGFSFEIQSQTVVTNFQENQDINWLSVSAQGPGYGFYGQEFSSTKNVKLKAISVFIFDHAEHDETNSTVNFLVWSFDHKPLTELFRSDAIKVENNEINGWKTFTFKKPKKVKKGRYLVGIGQPKIQGFVAFGSGVAKQDHKSRKWAMMPIEGYADGTAWVNMTEIAKSAGASDEQVTNMENSVIMMKLEYK